MVVISVLQHSANGIASMNSICEKNTQSVGTARNMTCFYSIRFFYCYGFQFQLVFLYRIFVELKSRVFLLIKLELFKPSQLDSSDYFDKWFVVFGQFFMLICHTHTHILITTKMIHNKVNLNTNQSHLQQSNILKLHDVRSFITFCCSNLLYLWIVYMNRIRYKWMYKAREFSTRWLCFSVDIVRR